jgi:hypothetical protein
MLLAALLDPIPRGSPMCPCGMPRRLSYSPRRRLGVPGACLSIMPIPFRLPHHVLRPRDRCRTITPLLLFGVLPEPVHATLSEAEISTITHFARVPGKELPQEAPSSPVPVCPPPALADLHDAHSHPGFTMRQHSAHVEIPPIPRDATISRLGRSINFENL